jgi:2-polyprenyl-3-methyl-5-hydroxy-6-metoxy-1,4-benzoquinol methylase
MEPTPDLAQTCRERGLETIEQSFEAYTALAETERFSVVAAFEVIEHLFSPRDFLQSVHRMLSPGGLLILTCPNGRGFDIEALGNLSDSVDYDHLNYFSPRSLGRLLVDCDFQVLDEATPGRLDAELVRKKALSGEFDLSGQPFLQHVLIDDWDRLGGAFQKFLADNGLSSHLWIVARKME